MRRTGQRQRLRVLFLAKGLGPGGMERLLVNHAATGDRERFDYHVAYLVERPDSVIAELESLGVDCVRLTAGSSGDPRWVAVLRRLVLERRIDVLHSHSPQPAAIARPVMRAMRGGPKLVYTEHNTWDCYGLVTRVANALTYPLDHAQFAVSSDARGSVPKPLRRHVEVLTHGIDLDNLRACAADRAEVRVSLGIGDDEVIITNLAHLRSEKAQEDLLAAAARVVRNHPEVVVLSVGHGPRAQELSELHGRLGLGDRFRFLGFRGDATQILGASDVFCLSSHQEGLPLAFMEAGALGVPTVSTRVGGIPDHLDEGVSGLLVPPRDVDALAGALEQVVADRGLRHEMGTAAQEHSHVFDARRSVLLQEQAYDRLCGRVGEVTSSGGR